MTEGGRTSRRRVIAGGGAVLAVGAVAGPGRGLHELLPWADGGRGTLERSSMQEHLGARFRVERRGQASATLVLVAIEELPYGAVTDRERQFAARFAARAGTDLAQDTYQLASRRFGDVDLFLSPIHEPDDPLDHYEALFNRPVGVTL